jgi:hypothetical protein
VAVPPELRPFGDELCAAVVAALRLRQLRGDEGGGAASAVKKTERRWE